MVQRNGYRERDWALSGEIKRKIEVVATLTDNAIVCLVGALLHEQNSDGTSSDPAI